MSTEKVAIVIPALNEEAAIRQLLTELPRDCPNWIIVVDNGSTDGTASVAQAAGVIVASEPTRGYGQACLKGFKAACSLGAEIVVFMDGDGSDDPADLPLMLEPVREGIADMTIGSRVSKRSERRAIPPQARIGNWLGRPIVPILYGARLPDMGSFRAIRGATCGTRGSRAMTFLAPAEVASKIARARY